MNQNIKKYGPWIGLAIVIIVILFRLQKFRSGYTVQQNNAPPIITMMDLREYSAFTPEQKATYTNMLEKALASDLLNAAQNNSLMNYQSALTNVMLTTMKPQPLQVQQSLPAVPGTPCPPGEYSQNGKMPSCKPCPMNTYCPDEGIIYPTNCPVNTRSHEGSKNVTECIPAPMM